jgi:Replication-relaxation
VRGDGKTGHYLFQGSISICILGMVNKKPSVVVQQRDRQLLGELSVMRVIDREQAKTVGGFGSVTRVNRRLLALVRAGLLKRFFIGTTCWKKSLYALSPAGAHLVRAQRLGPRKRNDEIVTVSSSLSHQLGINEIYCALKYQSIPETKGKFVRWYAPGVPIDSQRSLIPDGYVEILVQDSNTLAAFIEYDLGHESLRIWKAKVRKYLRYAIAGEFEHSFRHPQFRVVVVTSSKSRCEALRKATASLTDKIFWFATMDSVREYGVWSHIWFRPQQGGPIYLL